jgi:hypothetical protein
MAASKLQLICLSAIAAIAITFLTAADPVNLLVSHSINARGQLSQICLTSVVKSNGGLPLTWISDSYTYCGGYRDSVTYSLSGLASDLIIWFVAAMIALDFMQRMNSRKGKKGRGFIASFLPPLPRTSGRGLFPLSP